MKESKRIVDFDNFNYKAFRFPAAKMNEMVTGVACAYCGVVFSSTEGCNLHVELEKHCRRRRRKKLSRRTRKVLKRRTCADDDFQLEGLEFNLTLKWNNRPENPFFAIGPRSMAFVALCETVDLAPLDRFFDFLFLSYGPKWPKMAIF